LRKQRIFDTEGNVKLEAAIYSILILLLQPSLTKRQPANLVNFHNILLSEISILNRNILDIICDKNANKTHPTSFKNTRNKTAERNKKNTREDA